MKKTSMITILVLVLALGVPALAYQSLYEVYQDAGGYGNYDKWIDLDPTVEYLGNLNINGVAVYINGHGAIIHGRVSTGAICVTNATLDIENCIFVEGGAGIYLGNGSAGEIHNNVMTGMTDSGIRSYYIGANNNVNIWDNIITDCNYGFFGIEGELPQYIAYNTVFNATTYRYAEYCPG